MSNGWSSNVPFFEKFQNWSKALVEDDCQINFGRTVLAAARDFVLP